MQEQAQLEAAPRQLGEPGGGGGDSEVRLRPSNEWLRVPPREPSSAAHGVHTVGGGGGDRDGAAAAPHEALDGDATAASPPAAEPRGRDYFKALREAAKLK